MKRYEELDSIRGISSLVVMIGHHLMIFSAFQNYSYDGTALWESLVEKPRGKAFRESHWYHDPIAKKCDTAATAREESARACPHSRRGLTPLGRLQKYPKIHVSTVRKPQVPAPTPHKVLGPGIDGRGIPSAPEQLAWGLAFPEATRAGPWGPCRKSRAPAATRENSGGSPLQARWGPFPLRHLDANHT